MFIILVYVKALAGVDLIICVMLLGMGFVRCGDCSEGLEQRYYARVYEVLQTALWVDPQLWDTHAFTWCWLADLFFVVSLLYVKCWSTGKIHTVEFCIAQQVPLKVGFHSHTLKGPFVMRLPQRAPLHKVGIAVRILNVLTTLLRHCTATYPKRSVHCYINLLQRNQRVLQNLQTPGKPMCNLEVVTNRRTEHRFWFSVKKTHLIEKAYLSPRLFHSFWLWYFNGVSRELRRLEDLKHTVINIFHVSCLTQRHFSTGAKLRNAPHVRNWLRDGGHFFLLFWNKN